MRRRNFLKIGGAIAVASAIPPASVNVSTFFSRSVKSILTTELHYLTIDPKALDQFVAEFTEYMKEFSFITQQKLRTKITLVSLLRRNAQVSTTTNYLVSKFLLSTDFFVNYMDESRTIQYVALHDLERGACLNPFSHIYYPKKG